MSWFFAATRLCFGLSGALSLVVLTACAGDAQEAATACGDQTCPAGTTPVMSAGSSGGVQVEGEVDPSEWAGGLAVRTFGEGECAFSCLSIQECPEGTWPVFSYSCFTCASLNDEGELVQGSCGTTSVAAAGESPPGGACDTDADCPGGYACGVVDECEESCVVDSHCKADFICGESGACVLPECLSDRDCGGGFACDDYSLFCEERCITGSDCQSGFTCDNVGACVRPECQTDADCRGQDFCGGDGFCVELGGCSTAPMGLGVGAFAALLSVLAALSRLRTAT